MTLCFSCLRKFEKKSQVNEVVIAPGTSENRQEVEVQPAQPSRMFCITTRCPKERPAEEKRRPLPNKDNKPTRSNNKFSFGWRGMRRKSTTCSGGSTYDYIDSINDPVYSKVGEVPPNSHRYDYPAFGAYPPHRRPPNEPFYTSASQIYYMASDDPYSSIVSETRRNTNYELESNSSGVYDIGYEKMAMPSTSVRTATAVALTAEGKSKCKPSQSTTSLVSVASSRKGLDALYAKINRLPNSEFVSPKDDQHMHGRQVTSSPFTDQSDSETLLYQRAQTLQQEDESGSGSVGSFYTGTGSSQNPSYRYLTVREPVDIIRERIRRQEFLNEQQREANELFQLPHREHYYSTIANEYESVGGDERSSATGEPSTSERNATAGNLRSSQQSRRHQVFRLFPSTASITSPLSLLTGRFYHHNNHYNTNNNSNGNLSRPVNIDLDSPVSGQHNGEARPRPPTSPIPNRSAEDLRSSPNSRPVILSPTLPLPDTSRAVVDSAVLSSNASLLTIRNYNDVIGRPTAPASSLHHNAPAQRNSCSYDSRTNAGLMRPVELTFNGGGTSRRDDTMIAAMLTRRNRVSAPPNHPQAGFISASATLIPPPLPPLPTPHGHNVHLLRKAIELEEKDATNLSVSRGPAFARNSPMASLAHRSVASPNSTTDVPIKASPKHTVDHSQNVLGTAQTLLA